MKNFSLSHPAVIAIITGIFGLLAALITHSGGDGATTNGTQIKQHDAYAVSTGDGTAVATSNISNNNVINTGNSLITINGYAIPDTIKHDIKHRDEYKSPQPLGERSAVSPQQNAELQVSGTGVTLSIKEGDESIPLQSTAISSTGARQRVYLPKGQPLLLSLTGTGINVTIEKNVSPQVQVRDTGVGNTVSED